MSYGYGLSASLLQLARAYTVFARDGEVIPVSMLRQPAPEHHRARLAVVADLSQAQAVLSWDENVYLPPAAAPARRERRRVTTVFFDLAGFSTLTRDFDPERLRDLHERARTNLRALQLANLHLLLGDGMLGYASGAPYAGILAAACGPEVPQSWIDQLAPGGRLVAPLEATRTGVQTLLVLDQTEHGPRVQRLEAVHFVPLKSGIA